MARKTSLTSLKQISEINLTPLMDLTFILLITFIITFPLIEQGVAINLPAGTATPIVASEAHTISLDVDGQHYLDNHPIDLGTLPDAVAQLVAADPTTTVLVRADERLPYGEVVAVLKILHAARVSSLSLVTREE